MRKLLWFAACCILIGPPSDFAQNSSKDGWGSWRYTWQNPEYWSGIPFRSKCISSSGGDSKWEYQFKSRYSHTMDFVGRVEHGLDGAATNDFNRPEAFALGGGALSPVYDTVLHGACDKSHDLKIEVICVTLHDLPGQQNMPCFQDANGAPLEFKPIPDHPRYQ